MPPSRSGCPVRRTGRSCSTRGTHLWGSACWEMGSAGSSRWSSPSKALEMSERHGMDNRALAETFDQIGDLLEIKGELVYKVLAYRRAAESIRNQSRAVADLWREDGLRSIPGVGEALATKIDELMRTGKLGFFEKLKREVPVTLVD